MDKNEELIEEILATNPEMDIWNDLNKLGVGIAISGLVDSFEWEKDVIENLEYVNLLALKRRLTDNFISINIYITQLTLEDYSIIEIKTVKEYNKNHSIGDLFEYSYIEHSSNLGNELKYVSSNVMLINYISSSENIYRHKETIKRVGLREVNEQR